MRSDWRTAHLEQLGRIVTGRTPPGTHPDFFGSDVPFVTPSDMDGRRIIAKPARFLSAEGVDAVRSAVVPYGVAVSCIGWQMGKAAILDRRSVTNQQINTVVPDESAVSLKYLYYEMSSRRREIFRLGSGGSRTPILKKSAFGQLLLRLPSLSEQKAIAHILGTLDDKIELNRQMNETLEATGRALFKSWFVDFDPVRAKLNGQKPVGMDEETAGLFPDGFQDSPLGHIPTGWEVDALKNRASNIQYGYTQSATSDSVGPRFLRITDIRGGRVDWSCVPYCRAGDAETEKYRVMDGDVFVARTGASTGDNVYIVEPPESVFASYLVRFQFESPGIARFVGEYMRSPDYFSHVEGSIGGSAQPNASAQTLAAATVDVPPNNVAEAFYRIVRPFDQRRAANARQSDLLSKLRDTLLPKLLSGEIRVPDANKLVEGAL